MGVYNVYFLYFHVGFCSLYFVLLSFFIFFFDSLILFACLFVYCLFVSLYICSAYDCIAHVLVFAYADSLGTEKWTENENRIGYCMFLLPNGPIFLFSRFRRADSFIGDAVSPPHRSYCNHSIPTKKR